MLTDLALIATAASGGLGAWAQASRGRRVFAAALAVTAGLALAALAGAPGVVTALALGAGAFLLVIGPAARRGALVAMGLDRFGVARALLEVADVLQPGAGVAGDKVTLAAFRRAYDGDLEPLLTPLRQLRAQVDGPRRRAIDMQIVSAYLLAGRDDEAIAHADGHLPLVVDEGATELPIAPALWVELIDALGRRGELVRAAAMVADVERLAADRPETYPLRHHARVVLLAWTGQVTLLAPLLRPAAARHLTPPARAYWRGVAAARAGDLVGARAALERARGGARLRLRRRVATALAELDAAPPPTAPPLEVALAIATPLSAPRYAPRRRWVGTLALVVAHLGVVALLAALVGPVGDVGALVRGGAAVAGLVDAGEWWRLIAAIGLDASAIHLLVHVLALWSLGRWVESLHGPAALVAIYGLAGVAGVVVAHHAGVGGVVVGSSAAMFGLVGATLVEPLTRPGGDRRWGGALVRVLPLALAQLLLDVAAPVGAPWAHATALGVGAALALVWSPHRPAAWRHASAVVLAALVVGALATATVLVVRTPAGATFDRGGLTTHALAGLLVDGPARWAVTGDELGDADVFLWLAAAPAAAAEPLDAWLAAEPGRSRARGFARSEPTAPLLALPPGWQGHERLAVARDALGSDVRYRVVSAGSAELRATLYVPASLAAPLAGRLTAVLASLRRAPAP